MNVGRKSNENNIQQVKIGDFVGGQERADCMQLKKICDLYPFGKLEEHRPKPTKVVLYYTLDVGVVTL